ncbi:nitroreductase [Cryptococcus deuterogattii 99/473]|uniref:Nitroreductase n=2 Tax=Cryptococcus deuterogattii TaxID=1859096 RepID=A0A0D0V8G9_9TREE|nr:nitroreductase [Cryptococcus deuterogattii R265]KIR30075.1 nitroreductase [Cryptococcus deuterogattii LA55]KIR37337.1 nitroreductase [Cryptococcus deuterogattii MMRL2647]KIR43806.1 nitroreductase [Cryptococcus deuterogattii Ram5]KIR75138.1 nitroreductase [Cryptococcus deuterogattii CA1014]KIR92807.1 nitroreductase [Cryptococcus deuterogattii CBS 10090]KIR98129.1 nitroreductase [Cryptococcus deuterogattii 2001/935-1]KIY60352.1 nitroreductase [Cryptococcus deuterogattii 99/473]
MSKSAAFFEAVTARRSYYNLTNKSTLSNAQLQEIVEKSVKYAPTSFNGQQSRAVLVTGSKHNELWDKITETHLRTLKGDKGQEEFWANKIRDQYRAGYGTVIFFEDQDIVNGFSAKMPAFSQAFPIWSENSAGILQYITWTALAAEGHGASLQHYAQFSAETQAAITELVDVSPNWKVTGLLPFGIPSGPPGREKAFEPIEKRTKFFFDE